MYDNRRQGRTNHGPNFNKGKRTSNEGRLVPDEQKVVNPYTFLPLSEEHKVYENAEEYYHDRKLRTGVLHCKLITKSPLAIVDTNKSLDASGHSIYHFNQEDGVYTVPGSSIRGAIRSTYESLTNSCFVTLKDETPLTVRKDPKQVLKPGILQKVDGQFKLYSADTVNARDINIKVDLVVRNGKNVINKNNQEYFDGQIVYCNPIKEGMRFFTKSISKNKNSENRKEGILQIGEKHANKRYVKVFVKKSEYMIDTSRLTRAIDILQNVVHRQYRDLKTEGTAYAAYTSKMFETGMPVWFEDNGVVIHLTYAAIGRIAFQKTLNEIVGDHCDSRKKVCPACLLFGMIGKNENSLGSKVRFTNATLDELHGKVHSVTLKELGSPHSSYFPFYAQPVNGQAAISFDNEGTTISGRKFYWHHAKLNRSDYQTEEKNNRNVTVEIIEANNEFSFDVYYDDITDVQLNQLVWTLTLGENNINSFMNHKIGHGKPLGLGSVKILIESAEERNISSDTYEVNKLNISELLNETPAFDKVALQFVKKVFNQNAIKKYPIMYPHITVPENTYPKHKDNEIASHQWYREFKKKGNNVLPSWNTPEDKLALSNYKYVRTQDQNSNKKQNGFYSGNKNKANGPKRYDK